MKVYWKLGCAFSKCLSLVQTTSSQYNGIKWHEHAPKWCAPQKIFQSEVAKSQWMNELECFHVFSTNVWHLPFKTPTFRANVGAFGFIICWIYYMPVWNAKNLRQKTNVWRAWRFTPCQADQISAGFLCCLGNGRRVIHYKSTMSGPKLRRTATLTSRHIRAPFLATRGTRTVLWVPKRAHRRDVFWQILTASNSHGRITSKPVHSSVEGDWLDDQLVKFQNSPSASLPSMRVAFNSSLEANQKIFAYLFVLGYQAAYRWDLKV